MEQKKRKTNVWLWILLVVDTIVMIAALLFLIGIYGFASMLTMLNEEELSWNIHRYPNKITYVVGVDTSIDLTGGELCFGPEGDDDSVTNSLPCTYHIDRKRNNDIVCETIRAMTEVPYTTDAELTKKGIYTVLLEVEGVSCSFPIEVIDPKDAVN